MTPTERKRIQRARDKAAGWTEVNIRVGQEYAEALRDFAASLPPPACRLTRVNLICWPNWTDS